MKIKKENQNIILSVLTRHINTFYSYGSLSCCSVHGKILHITNCVMSF